MSSIQAHPAMPSGTLTDLVSAVQDDPTIIPSAIQGRIAATQESGHVVMMGGWTDQR
ncbi:hypothetical protein ABZ419_21825 [Streptomyces cinnamoneus]|uniref:hypothetical protein n=1 Tax=Streptomyces cinnamoneus TaxID=53446 RepID=UPI0033FCFBD4